MGYFDDEKNMLEYIEMANGYDGAELIEALRRYLPAGSTVLELGMGPGKDLDILSRTYQATGSDLSRPFLDRYKKGHKNADVMLLDAITIDTDRTFDGVYSNKVLHHLIRDGLRRSLARQRSVLNKGGLFLHSFWYGDKEEEMHGLRFVYYLEEQLRDAVEGDFEILALERYKEMEVGDSIYVVAKKSE